MRLTAAKINMTQFCGRFESFILDEAYLMRLKKHEQSWRIFEVFRDLDLFQDDAGVIFDKNAIDLDEGVRL